MLRVLVGNAADVLATLPPESVHCVVTSPPYYGLRDYGTHGQLGLEATPAEFIASMVAVFREVRSVLRKDGTLWLNIGDSYAGSHGFYPDAPSNMAGSMQSNARGATSRNSTNRFPPGYKPKDLIGIPWMLAFALREDGWYLRSDIIWSKPNPMPESVQDRPTKAHEYLFLLTRSSRYYYDSDALREDSVRPELIGKPNGSWGAVLKGNRQKADGTLATGNEGANAQNVGLAGRNKRSVWEIATEPFPEAHFATYPTALVEPCIKAGTSEKGCCPECGAPWARVVERGEPDRDWQRRSGGDLNGEYHGVATKNYATPHDPSGDFKDPSAVKARILAGLGSKSTTGWRASCAHADLAPVPCTILDPFCGAGTTLLVADRLDRDGIGIELNSVYAEMARKRIFNDAPLFAEVESA